MRIAGQTIETAEDVQRICAEGWLEGQQLEFTKAPLKASKVTSEVVALANHLGGHVILGIEETDIDGRKRAAAIKPIEACAAEAQNRARSLGDTIDPPIRGLEVKHIVTDPSGAGVIIIEVPQSLFGPHRSTIDKEVYLRSGEQSRAQRMTEIHRLVLAFEKREDRLEKRFERLRLPNRARFIANHGQLHFRVGACPLGEFQIDLKSAPQLWLAPAKVKTVAGVEDEFEPPARRNAGRPMLRGRMREATTDVANWRTYLHEDGSVQLILYVPAIMQAIPYAVDVIGQTYSALCCIDEVASYCGYSGGQYGIEVEFGSREGCYFAALGAPDTGTVSEIRAHSYAGGIPGGAYELPRYSYFPGCSKTALVNDIWIDIWNSVGCEAPDEIASIVSVSATA